ncbi:MAG: type II toxin-antitoxin system RelE/ParE family toxin [Blastocatellia bacterium]|nr:type II toxin-antitoxin system RelE/ParE family toxin [Blastocatellia bacterium]
MAYRIKWSPKAAEDVEALASYISQDSPVYAAAVVKKILDITRNLSYFPFAGRVVPEFEEDRIREQFAYSYRVIYRIEGETVTIAAVIHGKRLLEKDIQP